MSDKKRKKRSARRFDNVKTIRGGNVDEQKEFDRRAKDEEISDEQREYEETLDALGSREQGEEDEDD